MQKHIGLFGGTFDPIHFGHLRVALEVKQQLQLDQVRFIPCHRPAHRTEPHASAAHRLAMTQLAIADQPGFYVDECELKHSAPSYTIDTLKTLRDQFGNDAAFYLLIGADAFSQIDQWSRWQQLLDLTHIVVMERAGQCAQLSPTAQDWLEQHSVSSVEKLAACTQGSIIQLKVTALDISASQIRQLFNAQLSANFLLPESVIGYIRQHHLYLTGAPALS